MEPLTLRKGEASEETRGGRGMVDGTRRRLWTTTDEDGHGTAANNLSTAPRQQLNDLRRKLNEERKIHSGTAAAPEIVVHASVMQTYILSLLVTGASQAVPPVHTSPYLCVTYLAHTAPHAVVVVVEDGAPASYTVGGQGAGHCLGPLAISISVRARSAILSYRR